MTADLSRTVLAISSFHSDEAVLRLLECAFRREAAHFGAVIVVDSLGSGRIEAEASARGWPVEIVNSDVNLGSAGNLAKRLERSASTGLDWCLALNHDAVLETQKAAMLVSVGERLGKTGAIYPQLHFTSAGKSGRYDRPRRHLTLFGLTSRFPLPPGAPVRVAWGSSNGALYALDAIRGIDETWARLWMGYEDLALGWELERSGWKQWLCPEVVVDDNYEFRSIGGARFSPNTADKPPWYSYYQARNTTLIARRTGWRAIRPLALGRRLATDLALIALVKKDKGRRLYLWWQGFRDGWNGRDGKGPVP